MLEEELVDVTHLDTPLWDHFKKRCFWNRNIIIRTGLLVNVLRLSIIEKGVLKLLHRNTWSMQRRHQMISQKSHVDKLL
jgi:hypothetical protein